MNKRMKWILISILSILGLFISYMAAEHILLINYNLVLRDWIMVIFNISLAIFALILELNVLAILNQLLEYKISMHSLFKGLIRLLSIILIFTANIYVFFFFLLNFGLSLDEVAVENIGGEKYVVVDSSAWIDPGSDLDYHLYENIFVYHREIKHLELQLPADDEENSMENAPPFNPYPGDDEVDPFKIDSNHVEFSHMIENTLSYGFYLQDKAGHQYLYALVKSIDQGLSWTKVAQLPPSSELYFAQFLNEDLGFANFGSSDVISLYRTSDGGITWQALELDSTKGYQDMIFVQEIAMKNHTIELILGYPSWTNFSDTMNYYSKDLGETWFKK